MFRFLRETWETLHAIAVLLRHFFVKWFLPLHSDEDEEEEEERASGGWFDMGDADEPDEMIADKAPRQIDYAGEPSPPEPLRRR